MINKNMIYARPITLIACRAREEKYQTAQKLIALMNEPYSVSNTFCWTVKHFF